MSWVAVGVGVVTTGYKVYDSARKNSAAKKLAANNVRPDYTPSPEIGDVYNLALSEVNNTQQQDYATRQLDNSFSNGIDAVLKSGGKADFGTVYNTYGNQMNAILSTLSKSRDAKIAAANNAAYNVAASKDASFQYNQDAPFKDAKQREAILRQQAEQSKMDAIDTAASTVANYGTATTNPGQYGTTGSIDNTGVNTAPRMANANPEKIGTYNQTHGFDINSTQLPGSVNAPASNDLSVENINTKPIVGYNVFGDPIYAH